MTEVLIVVTSTDELFVQQDRRCQIKISIWVSAKNVVQALVLLDTQR
jgi:hypothetical protein